MRRTILTLVVCLLAAPAAGWAALGLASGDGALSVSDARGQVVLNARGGVIGRFDRGCVTVVDLTPDDLHFPQVWGDDRPQVDLPRAGTMYCGRVVRFRLLGGKFRIVVSGTGLDLSAVGQGDGTIVADDAKQPGVYSLDGDDCDAPRAKCRPLPLDLTRFKLGTLDRAEKSPQRSDP